MEHTFKVDTLYFLVTGCCVKFKYIYVATKVFSVQSIAACSSCCLQNDVVGWYMTYM